MLTIGIAGGSGSGKTTVVKAITERLEEKVVVIPQDSYYKDSSHLSEEEKTAFRARIRALDLSETLGLQ